MKCLYQLILAGCLTSEPRPVSLSSYSLHECRPETGLCPTAADTRKGGKRDTRVGTEGEGRGKVRGGQEGRGKTIEL